MSVEVQYHEDGLAVLPSQFAEARVSRWVDEHGKPTHAAQDTLTAGDWADTLLEAVLAGYTSKEYAFRLVEERILRSRLMAEEDTYEYTRSVLKLIP